MSKTENLLVVIAFIREQCRETEALAFEIMELPLANDLVANRLYRRLWHVQKTNANTLNVVNLLDESGPEAALREVQFQQRLRKELKS